MSAADAKKAAPKEDLEGLRSALAAGTLTGDRLSAFGLLVRALSDDDSLSRFLESILADAAQAASTLGCDLSEKDRADDGERVFRIHRKIEAVRYILQRAFDAGIFSEADQ